MGLAYFARRSTETRQKQTCCGGRAQPSQGFQAEEEEEDDFCPPSFRAERVPSPEVPGEVRQWARELLDEAEEPSASEPMSMAEEPPMFEAEAPLNVDEMLHAEEEEDEAIMEAAISDLQTRPHRFPLLLPPPSTSSPPSGPQIQTEASDISAPLPRAEEARPSEERPLPPSPASEAPPTVEVPPPASSSSGQAENLMERVQRLVVSIADLIAQPAPLSQQTATAEPQGLATLLEAARQHRVFLDLPDSEALSLLG